MRYIASCSFGKDSLAAIICRMERGEPVEGAVYCRLKLRPTELWQRFLAMEKDGFRTFKPIRTLRDFDTRFANEEAQINLFDDS
jgi:hypothetical protein